MVWRTINVPSEMKTIAAITSKAFCLKTGHDGLILRTATACVTVREPDAVMTRRFPPPWSVEVTPNCFIVRDADGQQLAYVYYENEPGRRSGGEIAHQR